MAAVAHKCFFWECAKTQRIWKEALMNFWPAPYEQILRGRSGSGFLSTASVPVQAGCRQELTELCRQWMSYHSWKLRRN